ncbi:protein SSUH2 homolog [Acanthaster planci]|uniref:Protein SSUH2 homolog n=1 Tax=Acanthaster planci TaxID=133434 RepID=A0A8B7YER5_ACAPL|nr:protein SSUH2 homolog [Acanthaster planci]
MAELTGLTGPSQSLPPVESSGIASRQRSSYGQSVRLPPLSQQSQSQAPPPYNDVEHNTLLASGGLRGAGMDQSIPWRAPPGETDTPTYHWPDAPDTDVEDNEKVREPVYKMAHALPTIPGHERTSTKESKPAERPKLQIPHNDRREFKSGNLTISHEEAKGCLVDMTSHRCCYGSGAARELEVQEIEYSAAAKYSLETFVESRTSKRACIPYKGQTVDSPQEGAPPALWEAAIEAPEKYKPCVKTVRVPHCSIIETCYACSGRGFNKCYRCKGRGKTKCRYCKARGQRGNKECEYCRGKGRQRCFRCNGHAVISCSVCEAYKQLEFFIEVTSTFKVKTDEYLHHADKRLPRKLLRGIEGITLFEEEAQIVAPLSNFPTLEVNSQSEKLVAKHANVKTERLILQRHKLVGIPIAQVEYTRKGKGGKYWLYGQQRKVYAPDYPQQCCCSCRCPIC